MIRLTPETCIRSAINPLLLLITRAAFDVYVTVRAAKLARKPHIQAAFVESVAALRHNLNLITFCEIPKADRTALVLEAVGPRL